MGWNCPCRANVQSNIILARLATSYIILVSSFSLSWARLFWAELMHLSFSLISKSSESLISLRQTKICRSSQRVQYIYTWIYSTVQRVQNFQFCLLNILRIPNTLYYVSLLVFHLNLRHLSFLTQVLKP